MRQRNKVDQALRDHGDPLLRVVFAPAMSVGAVARLARFTVPGLCLLSLYLAVYSSTTLVSLLLLGYAGVTQFFPGVVLGLFWKRANSTGVLAGIIAGVGTTAFLILSGQDPFMGLNAGFVALCLNFVIAIIGSVAARRSHV